MIALTKYLPYNLELEAPAIVTTLSGDPNRVTTQPFVPGGAVRGAVASRLSDNGSVEALFRKAILEGAVRYLHAYPAYEGNRTLPVPLSWYRETGAKSASCIELAFYTGAIDGDTDFEWDDGLTIHPEDVWPAVPLERQSAVFVAYSGSKRVLVDPTTDARMHQQRDRDIGRPWKKDLSGGKEKRFGEIFSYEYLEAGQKFRGLIQITVESEAELNDLASQIKALLDQRTILIGRSRRAGYGGSAKLVFDDVRQEHEARWGDVQSDDVAAGESFRAYLVATCIVRDSTTGQIDPAALPLQLVNRLGGRSAIDLDSIRCYWGFESIGGFNRKWRLEVPQAQAVRAGAVLLLNANQRIPAQRLREIEHSGIGERRIEGFGRLVFLREARQPKFPLTQFSDEKSPRAPKGPPPDEVRFIQRRMLDAAVLREIDSRALDLVRMATNVRIITSLLGRLRVPLRIGDTAKALDSLRQMINGSGLKDEARKKLATCRIDDQPLVEWLQDQTGTPDDKRMKIVDAELERKHRVADEETLVNVARERRDVYTVQLIDAVLSALSRKARQEREEQDHE